MVLLSNQSSAQFRSDKSLLIDAFNLVPGFRCTRTCDHCSNDSSPLRSEALSENEVLTIIDQLNKYQPAQIVLTGGEVTIYLDIVERVLKNLKFQFKVTLTTNGSFAGDLNRIERVLSRITNLELVQLSFDKFHGSSIDSKTPQLLKSYCNAKGIRFLLSVCVSEAKDLEFAADAKDKYGCDVIFQKIEASGRAKQTGVQFKYRIFENKVLDQKCPNSGTVSFTPGKGFSNCCSNLIFNHKLAGVASDTIDELVESRFFKESTELTFGARLKELGLSEAALEPMHSAPCTLCEFIELKKIPTKGFKPCG